MKAILALEDETYFEGESFGATGECTGEVVFNTSMTGYQEVLTDPSYKGQIVAMTYPLIGNYGCNLEDLESNGPKVEGFIVREYSEYYSNWRAEISLGDFLEEHGIVGIQEIDTRALTRKLRVHGVMKGVISTDDLDPQSLISKAKESPGLVGRDLVREVTCDAPFLWEERGNPLGVNPDSSTNNEELQLSIDFSKKARGPVETKYNVVALDLGVKYNILRRLRWYGCKVTVLPGNTSAEQILDYDPDGIFLSNGPGDPEGAPYVVETVKKLIGTRPIFGICFGHQFLGLAFGGKKFKMKFGHRGANHPVKNLDTGRVEITTQNHGFCVDLDSLPDEIEITHINLNDQTLEGLRHKELPIFSVQYHPEASPGPHDTDYLFENFVQLMEKER